MAHRKKSKKTVESFFHDSHLFDLDDELLANIFKYLPDVKTINLVCRKFHKIAVSMVAGKEWLWIKNEEDIDDETLYESMMKSKRILRKAAIGESSTIRAIDYQDSDDFLSEKWYFQAALTVIGIKHGANITQLQLMNVRLPIGKLADLISFIANLKSLFLFFVNQDDNETAYDQRIYDEPLPEITDVIVYECGESVVKFLDQLPADSIKSLTAKVSNFETLKQMLRRQNSIRKLTLMSDDVEPFTADFFQQFDLTHLALNIKNMKNLPLVVERNRHLVSLDVNGLTLTGSALRNCVVPQGRSSSIQEPSTEAMSRSCVF